jgi:hypothetical protein
MTSYLESDMKILLKITTFMGFIFFALFILSCSGGGPPTPGREISLPAQGISIELAEGWEGLVVGTDWSVWERVRKGRADDPWVFPPITARNEAAGPQGGGGRYMNWRFKGVTGTFDTLVNPLTSQYPVPEGLWSLDPQKLELLEQADQLLPWPGLADVTAKIRLYENTHGVASTASLWHTYTVTFNRGPTAYEFVMSIPDTVYHRDWIDEFWASIIDVSIETGQG